MAGYGHRWRGVLFALLATGCVEPLDTSRQTRPSLTLGGEIYNELCNRVALTDDPLDPSGEKTRDTCLLGEPAAASTSARFHALHAERQAFVAAVDAAIPDSLTSGLNDYLIEILPIYESGQMQGATRAVAHVTALLASRRDSLAALERYDARVGYRPRELSLGLLKPGLTYPALDPLARALAALVRRGGAGEDAFLTLLAGVSDKLARLDPADISLTPCTLARFLLRQSPVFVSGPPIYVPRRDRRGIVLPARAADNTLVPPFADVNLDGLADVDDKGRLIDSHGYPVDVPPPFALAGESSLVERDEYGRLLGESASGLRYEYVNASETLLAGALHEAHTLFAEPQSTLLELAPALRPLIGPRAARTHEQKDGRTLTFQGFALDDSPVLDAAHAVASIADAASVFSAVQLVETLARDHEPEVAALVELVTLVLDWLDEPQFDAAKLEANSTLPDDLVALLTEIARRPGLLEDILNAMRTPEMRGVGPVWATYMRTKDRIDFNPLDINGPPIGDFVTPVDREQPDTWGNRSNFQRFMHLTHDTNHARMCNKEGAVVMLGSQSYGSYGECELFEIDNLAVFYLKAAIGRAEIQLKDPVLYLVSDLDAMLEGFSGITGFSMHPTVEAMNRVVFTEHNDFLKAIFDDPKAFDGGVLRYRHPGTIFAWEKMGFFDHMRPLFVAFDDHDALPLLADLFTALHLHWSSPKSDTTQSQDPVGQVYAHQTGVVRFEEVLARALDEGDALNVLADTLEAAFAEVVDGSSGETILHAFVRQLLLPEQNGNLRTRDGATSVTRPDGAAISALSPAVLLVEAVRHGAQGLDAVPGAGAALSDSLREVLHKLFTVDRNAGVAAFTDRSSYGLVTEVFAFFREVMESHWQKGDVREWATELTADLEDVLAHPATAGLLDLTEAIAGSPSARAEIEALVRTFSDPSSPDWAYEATLRTLVELSQMLDDEADLLPLGRDLAAVFDPDSGLLKNGVGFLGDTLPLDDDRVLTRILANLASQPAGFDESVLESIWDVAVKVNRSTPGASGPLSQNDWARLMRLVTEILTDETRGFERIYQLVENR